MTIDAALASSQSRDDLVGLIPVRNLWLLMLYASRLLSYHRIGGVNVEENPDRIPDLIAEVLAHEVERRLRRNLSYGYRASTSALSRVRGRIDVLTTHRHGLLARGLVACRFEDLTVNTPRNRLVRAALETMARLLRHRNRELSHRCQTCATTLKSLGVSGERPTRAEMSTDRIRRNDAADQLVVSVAILALNLALPTEAAGSQFFALPDRQSTWIRTLYEKAVAGFYDVVLSHRGWRVEPSKPLRWLIEQQTPGIGAILPSMITDVVLDSQLHNRRIVIDTKFNATLTSGRYREESLRSPYIYQIYAYLRSQEDERDPLTLNAAGLLLHPAIHDDIDETVVIQGHAIRFATVDLAAEARDIRARLLALLDFPFSPPLS